MWQWRKLAAYRGGGAVSGQPRRGVSSAGGSGGSGMAAAPANGKGGPTGGAAMNEAVGGNR